MANHDVLLYEEDGVDASVVFGIVGDLRVLAPDDFARLRDQTEFGNVHLNHRALGDDAQLRVERRRRILLDAQNGQLKRRLQFYYCCN